METKLDFIRVVVETFAPEAIGTYDMLTNKPIVGGVPLILDADQRLTVFLQMWEPGEAARARPH